MDPKLLEWTTVGPGPIEPSSSPRLLMSAALDAGGLPTFLAQAEAQKQPVLLVVNDGHRQTQTPSALEAIAECTRRVGFTTRFDVLIATGTHRFPPPERREFESANFTGCGLNIGIIDWHDATGSPMGPSVNGVRLNRAVTDHRFLLPIGSVEPHYFAGLTGAHKTVTIGCMTHEGIERNHAHAMSASPGSFRLAGNPVYEEIAAVVRELSAGGRSIFAINQVVCGGVLVEAAAGDPLETLTRVLPVVRDLFLRRVDSPADLLHLKVPPPLGRNLYQADKALKNNHSAVRDGGGIVLDAECREGIGPDAFLRLLARAPDYAAAVRLVEREGYRLGDHKAVRLRHLTDPACRGVRVALVSQGVSPQQAEGAGLRWFADAPSAVRWLGSAVNEPVRRALRVYDAGHTCVMP